MSPDRATRTVLQQMPRLQYLEMLRAVLEELAQDAMLAGTEGLFSVLDSEIRAAAATPVGSGTPWLRPGELRRLRRRIAKAMNFASVVALVARRCSNDIAAEIVRMVEQLRR